MHDARQILHQFQLNVIILAGCHHRKPIIDAPAVAMDDPLDSIPVAPGGRLRRGPRSASVDRLGASIFKSFAMALATH